MQLMKLTQKLRLPRNPRATGSWKKLSIDHLAATKLPTFTPKFHNLHNSQARITLKLHSPHQGKRHVARNKNCDARIAHETLGVEEQEIDDEEEL